MYHPRSKRYIFWDFIFHCAYSLPSLKIDSKTQELVVRRVAPLILDWEGSSYLNESALLWVDISDRLITLIKDRGKLSLVKNFF